MIFPFPPFESADDAAEWLIRYGRYQAAFEGYKQAQAAAEQHRSRMIAAREHYDAFLAAHVNSLSNPAVNNSTTHESKA